MAASAVKKMMSLFRLSWLIGPVFTKELRVTSRQRKQYVLRVAYLAALTIFVVLSWMTVVKFDDSGTLAERRSRMSEVGKTVINLIVWFQCIAAQLMAVIVTSTSFSDEIRKGTLGVLATTPLSNLRIVSGKLFSHMLQILVLLGISFPLLAIVRVLGGVPWGFVVMGLCVTMTASTFAGAVTMLLSMRFRRAYVTMALSVGVVLGVYAAASLVLALTCVGNLLIPYFVPFGMLGMQSVAMLAPGAGIPTYLFFWPVHCLIMGGAIFGVLMLCASALRKVALKQATGENDAIVPLPHEADLPPIQAFATASVRPHPGAAMPPPIIQPPLPYRPKTETDGPIRRVEGSPVIWREFLRPILGEQVARAAIIAVSCALLGLVYLLALVAGALGEGAGQASFVVGYLMVALAWTAVLAATTIAPERESRCWPILMTTTLANRHIVLAKVAGVLRRCMPIWILLGGHVLVFTILGLLHLVVVLHMLIITAGTLLFIFGLCLYLSLRMRRTTSAVMMAVAIPVALWGLLPAVVGMISSAAGWDSTGQGMLSNIHLLLNPAVQAGVVTAGGTSGSGLVYTFGALTYEWPFGPAGIGRTTLAVAAVNGVYALIGLSLAALTIRRLRRNVF